MRPLTIVWQRLVTASGQTCDRCGLTLDSLQRALATLKEVLAPLHLEPTLESVELTEYVFKAQPASSNRILIAGRPLEEWLGGRAGSSRCCSVCGDAECRTVEVGEAVFEVIPAGLIIKAALVAAAEMIEPTSGAAAQQREICSCAPTCRPEPT